MPRSDEEIYRLSVKILTRLYNIPPQEAEDFAKEIVDKIRKRQKELGVDDVPNSCIGKWCKGYALRQYKKLKQCITESDLNVVSRNCDVLDTELEKAINDKTLYEEKAYRALNGEIIEEVEYMAMADMLKLVFPSQYHTAIDKNIDFINDHSDGMISALASSLGVSRPTVRHWLDKASKKGDLSVCLNKRAKRKLGFIER
jgi:hypothetical protein